MHFVLLLLWPSINHSVSRLPVLKCYIWSDENRFKYVGVGGEEEIEGFRGYGAARSDVLGFI